MKKQVHVFPMIDQMSVMWKLLNTEEKAYLRENTKLIELKKNQTIYSEGDKPLFLYCLIKGKVKISKGGVGGRDQIVRMLKPSDNFGYRAFFADENYLTSAVATELSSVYVLPLKIFAELVKKNNKLSLSVLTELAKDLGKIDARVVSLTQKHIRGRLADTLLMLFDTYGFDEDGITLKGALSREDLACFANMTTSNAIRTLSTFVAEGVIAMDGRKIKFLDEAQLRKISRLG